VKLRAHVKRPLVLASLLFIPLFIGALSPQMVQQVRIVFTAISSPFLKLQDQAWQVTSNFIEELVHWPRLKSENRILKSELDLLKIRMNEIEEIKKENDRFKTLLHFKKDLKYEAIATRVIGRDPSHWSQYIVVDRGETDGVRENTVLVESNGLVGKVTSSGPRSSRAILIIDHESRVSAMNERSRDAGLIEGTGTPFLKMTYLDRDAKIEVGDSILSSGLGGVYPKGIPIGKVHMIGAEAEKFGIYAIVRPYVSFSKLEELLCISLPIEN
jgi:rod shape-determining protein MreC